MAADKDNIIDFPRQKASSWGEKDISHETYEKMVRLQIRGNVHEKTFHNWIVTEATARDLIGWVRESVGAGGMDAVFAGTRDAIGTMISAFSEKGCPIDPPDVAERPLRGDEPLWSGFHHLPPI